MNTRIIFLCLILLSSFSCQNDDWKTEIDNLRKELDIQRQLTEALQNKTTIQDVSYVENGCIIAFSDNSRIVLNNSTPLITLDENSIWLLNGQSTGIKAMDATSIPTITIGNNHHWFINGEDTGIVAKTVESSITNVYMDQKKMVFVFNDGTQISINLDIFAANAENEICLPRYLYMLSDVRNDIFVQPFVKRWRPEIDYVRFTPGRVEFSRSTERVISIDHPLAWQTITVALYNNNFDLLKNHSSIVRLGTKEKGTNEVSVQIIGDSFVQGAFFKDALLTKGYVPNIKMVGLRKISGETDQYDEGRGGDTMQDYFNIHTADTKAYQGFMHPNGGRYYGATGFWKNCHKVISGNTSLSYSCGRYDDFATKFDSETGYLLVPTKGDVQYDNALSSFVQYDGNQWIKVKKEDFEWNFDYGKYLDAWNIPAPLFLGEMLGLNDFRENLTADFTTWNKQIEIMKNSYLKAVPNGRFMILIPSSTCGSMNNLNSEFTLRQNAAMWRLRKNIIDQFDNRESEGYYLVDIGITIDNEDGYNKNENGVQTGNPHPYPNYPTMGIPIAAFIQYHRDK